MKLILTLSVKKVIKELMNCILPVSFVFSRRQSGMSDVVTIKQGHKDHGFKLGSVPSNHANSSVTKKLTHLIEQLSRIS